MDVLVFFEFEASEREEADGKASEDSGQEHDASVHSPQGNIKVI